MKKISETKAMRANMKEIREILKAIDEDHEVLNLARNNYTYDKAMARNRERFFDLMRQINEMAELAARTYNHYTSDLDEWMTAEATYKTTNLHEIL